MNLVEDMIGPLDFDSGISYPPLDASRIPFKFKILPRSNYMIWSVFWIIEGLTKTLKTKTYSASDIH